jgi:hypothetical protein
MMERSKILALVVALLHLQPGCGPAARRDAAGQNGKEVPRPDKELGSFEEVPGTGYLVAPIQHAHDGAGGRSSSWNLSSSSYKSGDYPRIHNYVFLELGTEKFQRLLHSNAWRILSMTGFPKPSPRSSDPPATSCFLYEIVKADTDGDGVLSSKDRITVALSNATGRTYTELITDVEEVHTKVMSDPSTLLVIYRSQDRSYIARVDLKSIRVVNTTELPSFGPDVR